MALIPNFDRIVATITAADIEKFLRSAAPADDKERVLNAKTNEIKMRLVGGYLIRTNQVSPARLNGTAAKPVPGGNAAKPAKTAKPSKHSKSTEPARVVGGGLHSENL
jgi:hypothetical protein